MVNFQGFVKAVDTFGGLQINVQVPVVDNRFPITDHTYARTYIPAGPQEMTGAQALIYARARHTSNDFQRAYRQQRVIISLREQMNVRSVLANLPALIDALKTSVKTDIPTDQLPALLSLVERVNAKSVRSIVFSSPAYGVDLYCNPSCLTSDILMNVARIRQTASQAFTLDPAALAARDAISAEAATVWLLNGSGRPNSGLLATHNADYLAYNGMNASAPPQKAATIATTKIVVYNGAEATLQKTIAFLENAYKVQATAATDPAVAADIIVTLGQDAPNLTAPTVGSIGPNPGIAQIVDRARL
jgi:hypothetical protein